MLRNMNGCEHAFTGPETVAWTRSTATLDLLTIRSSFWLRLWHWCIDTIAEARKHEASPTSDVMEG